MTLELSTSDGNGFDGVGLAEVCCWTFVNSDVSDCSWLIAAPNGKIIRLNKIYC